jgi:hypothetical protein
MLFSVNYGFNYKQKLMRLYKVEPPSVDHQLKSFHSL